MHDIPYEKRTLRSIGRSLGRICRYAGKAPIFYSVFAHSVVVASLLPAPLRIHGLAHDMSEAYTNDVVSLHKRESFRLEEIQILELIYRDHGVPALTPEIHAEVKAADRKALTAEIWTGAGREDLRDQYPDRNHFVEELTRAAMSDYPPLLLVETEYAGREFERLFKRFLADISATKAA